MELINLKEHKEYLKEYIKLCHNEWGSHTYDDFNEYIERKEKQILNGDKYMSVIGLLDDGILKGFISLFKEDGISSLTPWYATMYVKEEYRGSGLSKILNKALIDEARNLGYNRVYLKTELDNYYEKFGAKYMKNIDENEKLYYIDIVG